MVEKEEIIKNKINNLDERSDQVKEILGQAPNWVIRWGISVVLIIVILLLIGSTLISYNDIIPARVIITSKNPPAYIEAKSSGKLIDIFVETSHKVNKNQVLALIENTADFKDVLFLKDKIKYFYPNNNDFDSLKIRFPSNLKLGTIQGDYNAFRLLYQEYLNYKILNPQKSQIQNLKLQINTKRSGLNNSVKQLEYYGTELSSSENIFKKYEGLYKKEIISEEEYLIKKSVYSSTKRQYESLQSVIRADENAILALENNLRQADVGDQSLLLSTDQNLEEAKQNLENQILYWEQQYVLKSPIDGKITLFDKWNRYQNVKVGETLFTIVPNDIEGIIGRVTMPVQNSGKVKEDQDVIIKLDNYPYQEWGSLRGKIISISGVPKQGEAIYTIFIDLNSLNTSYNKTLEFKQEMQGTAEIIVEELTVLQRIFYQLRKVFNRE